LDLTSIYAPFELTLASPEWGISIPRPDRSKDTKAALLAARAESTFALSQGIHRRTNMIATILNTDWTATLANVPSYGMVLVSAPVVSFLAIKLLLLAKAASGDKKQREWVFTQERDADGLPVLATAKVGIRRLR
jgi:hypothetical protein